MSNKRYVLDAVGCIHNAKTIFAENEREEAFEEMENAYNEALESGKYDYDNSYINESEAYVFDSVNAEAQIWQIYSLEETSDRKGKLLNSIKTEVYSARSNHMTDLENPMPAEFNYNRILASVEELRKII